jgi:hypothetical protein
MADIGAMEDEARKLICAQLEAAVWLIQYRQASCWKASLDVVVRMYPHGFRPKR